METLTPVLVLFPRPAVTFCRHPITRHTRALLRSVGITNVHYNTGTATASSATTVVEPGTAALQQPTTELAEGTASATQSASI
jgi:hypothetical protein